MLESELLRTGKGKHDLSEMYVVRRGYVEKAINYIRMNGKCNFEQGGEGHDIPYLLGKYGIVPEEVYKGLEYGQNRHNHDEMLALLQGMMEKLKTNPGGAVPAWIANMFITDGPYESILKLKSVEIKKAQYTNAKNAKIKEKY